MNTLFRQDRVFEQIEEYLKVIAEVIIAATPVYAIWALSSMPAIPLV